ncbi:DUF2817 domain-containing protein [Mesorhizobium sp. LNHC209A00]|uniref:DUF2817 domain-containing protein n=1 Tax=Mesorhizobium TaxID=68287 RepID=UPI0003CFAF2D|nr:DUF2817 domain-containing protein [Mesorhizobium sp. LNHC209A00]ESY87281.1 hypothetical protein X738_32780 [Mesorhizobium sp. LNHC209A00]
MESFSDSYAEARGKFLVACAGVGARVTSYPREGLLGEIGEALATDVACLGPEAARRAAIVICGTHGSEAFAGSAILTRWLSNTYDSPLDVHVVFVHAINPWAFSYRTRTDENNVDINRNFPADIASPAAENPAYDAAVHLLHTDPSDAARALELHRAYKAHFEAHGWAQEGLIWQGQWHRPDGFMFGGRAPSWSNVTFRRIVREHLSSAATIGFLDWHTGIGQFGEVVHLIFDEPESAEHRAAAGWWGLTTKDDGVFKTGIKPKYRGLLCQAIRQERPDARIAGAVIEFGTADDYQIFRGDLIDRWLRFEGRDHPDANALRAAHVDTCCPSDISWRRLVEARGPELIDQLLAGVAGW